jgi:hypothetical protein
MSGEASRRSSGNAGSELLPHDSLLNTMLLHMLRLLADLGVTTEIAGKASGGRRPPGAAAPAQR